MNFITFFKKVQIFSLMFLLTCVTLDAFEPEADDIAELQKEAQGTGKVVLAKLSGFSDAVQQKGAEAVGLLKDGAEKVQKELQKIKTSDLYAQTKKTLHEGFDAVKGNVEKAVKKIRTIDLAETKKNISDSANQNLKAAQDASKNLWLSCKDWWNNKSEYSSDEVIMFGGTVIAVVTIAGITYVLYKNGTIKKIGDGIATYPALTTLSTVTIGLLLALMYKIYTIQTTPVVDVQ